MRTPNPYGLIGPKGTGLMVKMEPLWLVSEDANDKAAQLQLGGDILSFIGWNRIPKLSIRAGSDFRNKVQEGSLFSAGDR